MTPPFPLIEVRGTPAMAGCAYGALCRYQIKTAAGFYRQYVSQWLGPAAVHRLVTERLEVLKIVDPAGFAELEGVAAGANTDISDVMLINARSELLSAWTGLTECTVVGVSGGRTTTDNPLVAQTWEWLPGVQDLCRVIHYKPATGGPEILTFCEAGQLAKIGINNAGLAVCLNFLNIPMDETTVAQAGIPVHLLIRLILNCRSIQGALTVLQNVPRGGAVSLTLADASGRVVNVEVSPKEVTTFESTSGVVSHANDFEHTQRSYARGRAARSVRVETTVLTMGELTPYRMIAALADHGPGAATLCHHTGETRTLAGFVLDPVAGRMMVCRGPVCGSQYYEYTLPRRV